MTDEQQHRCPWCGDLIPPGGRVCRGCGRTVWKEEGVAAILSLTVPGVGHVYVGRLGVGIVLMMVAAAVFLIGLIMPPVWGVLLPLSIWSAYDAYGTARKINRGKRVT